MLGMDDRLLLVWISTPHHPARNGRFELRSMAKDSRNCGECVFAQEKLISAIFVSVRPARGGHQAGFSLGQAGLAH